MRIIPFALLAFTLAAGPLLGQVMPPAAAAAGPSADQLKLWVSIRQERVNVLKDEVKRIDARVEERLDKIVDTLRLISDSKDSRTKVARMKETTGKGLAKTITYYDQKRAGIKEELKHPRLRLRDEEKQKIIAIFDARIEKRTQQILELNKSMPAHEEHERYKATGNGWYGTQYERNEEYDQNLRMTSHTNTQRTAIVKQLDASIARLDRQSRGLKDQVTTSKDPAQIKILREEIAKTDALIATRREQRLDTLKPSSTPTHTVALREAGDMDKAMQTAIQDLRKDFNMLFERYNTLLTELSSLHVTEDALKAKTGA